MAASTTGQRLASRDKGTTRPGRSTSSPAPCEPTSLSPPRPNVRMSMARTRVRRPPTCAPSRSSRGQPFSSNRDIGCRAADVGDDEVIEPGQELRADDACGGPGQNGLDGPQGHGFGGRPASRRPLRSSAARRCRGAPWRAASAAISAAMRAMMRAFERGGRARASARRAHGRDRWRPSPPFPSGLRRAPARACSCEALRTDHCDATA